MAKNKPEIEVAVPQTPNDIYGLSTPYKQGQGLPLGGLRTVFDYRRGAVNSVCCSPTSKPGKRVY
jgi:hypothetical protein